MDHVDAHGLDLLGVLAQKLQDVLDVRLVGQPAEPNAAPVRAARDHHLLRQHRRRRRCGRSCRSRLGRRRPEVRQVRDQGQLGGAGGRVGGGRQYYCYILNKMAIDKSEELAYLPKPSYIGEILRKWSLKQKCLKVV